MGAELRQSREICQKGAQIYCVVIEMMGCFVDNENNVIKKIILNYPDNAIDERTKIMLQYCASERKGVM